VSQLHITRELWRKLARRELKPTELVELGLQHFFALCPTCEAEAEAFRRELHQPLPAGLSLASLTAVLHQQAPQLEAEQRRAERDLRDLLKLPPEQRLGRVERAWKRFAGLPLAERLLARSKAAIPGALEESAHLARLAEAVILRTGGGAESGELRALALTYQANGARAAGRLAEAAELFLRARQALGLHGAMRPGIHAEIDLHEGIHLRDQRHFEQAETLLLRAVLLFQTAGSHKEAQTALLILGTVAYYQGDLVNAIRSVEAVLEAPTLAEESYLHLSASHYLALYLCEAGEHEKALARVQKTLPLYASRGTPRDRTRLAWLLGKIARGRGELNRAEELLRKAREECIAAGHAFDTALISLDLCRLYLEQDRWAEIRSLATEMVRIFEAERVHREALAAAWLFDRAARREAVSRPWVAKLAAYLELARADPSYRFQNGR
jgi:hypothetical protein